MKDMKDEISSYPRDKCWNLIWLEDFIAYKIINDSIWEHIGVGPRNIIMDEVLDHVRR